MIDWRIEEEGYNAEKITSEGNKLLIGNGYLGIRGTLSEYQKSEYPAINLAGIYDQVGDAWREPLNAPNGLFTTIEVDGQEYRLPSCTPTYHKTSLDYRHGIYQRATRWKIPKGEIEVSEERFASLREKHLIGIQYSIHTTRDAEVVIYTGIDGEVWDINGPHYRELKINEKIVLGNTVPGNTVPENTVPENTVPENTVPENTVPENTVPENTVPENTLSRMIQSNNMAELLQVIGITQEKREQVCVSELIEVNFPNKTHIIQEDKKILRKITFEAAADKTYVIHKWISIYTSVDCADFTQKSEELVRDSKTTGYSCCIDQHKTEWEKKWSISEVVIEGDDTSMEALNYSIYHLHCIAPRHTDHLSIPARGLSGQTYKGAIFWDTEMFMLDFFLLTEPEVAKSLLKYRITTLRGAKEKAEHYGYQGAFYAWESQEGGFDACSDYNVTDVFTGRKMRTYFKDKQIHISAAIVSALMRYAAYTGSNELFNEGAAEVILECARFYYDLLVKKVHLDRYELLDVIGPDEYHERVNNNAYTNRMAKYTFESALHVIQLRKVLHQNTSDRIEAEYDLDILRMEFEDAVAKIYIPQPDTTTGIIEQFDGYHDLEEVSLKELRSRLLDEKEYWGGAYGIASHTKVIKQADVVTMLNLFSTDYSDEILLKNWEYYEPRTEHGSSLSACMYALLACKCNMPEKAYPFFKKSATADLSGGGKEWAGLIYIGGTHPASSGGAYMTAVEGFAGIHIEDGNLKVKPMLPKHWDRLQFHIRYRGELYKIDIRGEEVDISKVLEENSNRII